MSNPKTFKKNNVKSRQTVMGDFFSRSEQSKTPANSKGQKKANSPVKVKKEEKKALASQAKGAEKKTVQTVKEKAQETTKKTDKEVGNKEDKSKAVEKKEDKSISVVNREEKGVQRTSLKRKITGAGMFSFSWTRGAQRDTEEYRNGYPNKKDHPGLCDNYHFYMNQISSQPDGNFIDKIHVDWWGDYKLLEVHHGYIQWLFPIRESGLNWHAQELQLHEIKKIKKNKKAMKRLLTSYKMMLDFYGMELENEEDGTIKRAENWRERFRHLNRSYHNYLRITRILKCLGEFGYEHLKKNLVKFVLYEGLVEGTLSNLIDSCVKYWIGVLKEDEEREEMFDYYEKLAFDENISSKRRNRSPSPPSDYWSSLRTDSKSGKKVISKPDGSSVDEPTKKTVEKDENDKNEKFNNEFSDDEDSTLYYAMSLIDDKDETEKYGNAEKLQEKHRKDHEISDSGEETESSQMESQEMQHWINEPKSVNEEEIEGGSESYNSFENADAQGEVESKVTDSAEEKQHSFDKRSFVNDKLETASEVRDAKKTDCLEQVEVDGGNGKNNLVNDEVETAGEDQEAEKTDCLEQVEIDGSHDKKSLVNDEVQTARDDQEAMKTDCLEQAEEGDSNNKKSLVNDEVPTAREDQEAMKMDCLEQVEGDGSNNKKSLVNDEVQTTREDQEAMKTDCLEQVGIDGSNDKKSLVNDEVQTAREDQEARETDCVERLEVAVDEKLSDNNVSKGIKSDIETPKTDEMKDKVSNDSDNEVEKMDTSENDEPEPIKNGSLDITMKTEDEIIQNINEVDRNQNKEITDSN